LISEYHFCGKKKIDGSLRLHWMEEVLLEVPSFIACSNVEGDEEDENQ
jgi:hypothetical protein